MKEEKQLKAQVRDFWDAKSCGEIYAKGQSQRSYYEAQREARHELEPYIVDFAKFHEGRGKDVLEIGVGMGADHVEWAKSRPRSLTGIDITDRAIQHTRGRLEVYGLGSRLSVDDAENLSFPDESFDLVYSWGVLHHTPNTPRAIKEVWRVLRPGGTARIMIYHKHSLVGYMLWIRYALLAGHPGRSLDDVYYHQLESPGTKAYTPKEARKMFEDFSEVRVKSQLCFGDLLEGEVGQRHQGAMLSIAKRLWPRKFLRAFFPNHGLNLLIEARK